MAGIAIRAVELAEALTEIADVRIAAADIDGDPGLEIPVGTWFRHDPRTVRPHLEGVDAVITQPQWPLVARELRRCGARLIYDLGAPDPLETLETQRTRPLLRRRLLAALNTDRLTGALHDGDHFLASTDKQLDLWLGVMLGERLLDPVTYDGDPALERRLARVPHGLADEPPIRSGAPGLRGAFEQIQESDELILWNSGIWRWFDAETAIRAVALLAARRPSVKLIFMSRSAERPEHVQPYGQATDLARELGILDTTVLFNDGWVPYAERADWLLDADVALACHRTHLEARFSFRTRYLDCFWAGLPLVVTEGDELARRIGTEDLGHAVPAENPEAVARAIEDTLDRGRDDFAGRLRRVADEYRWSRVAEPLRSIVTGPPPDPRSRSPRRPGHVTRDIAYSIARTPLNLAGIRNWPRQ